MSTLRFQALKKTLNRKPVEVEEPARRSEIFGKNVRPDRLNNLTMAPLQLF